MAIKWTPATADIVITHAVVVDNGWFAAFGEIDPGIGRAEVFDVYPVISWAYLRDNVANKVSVVGAVIAEDGEYIIAPMASNFLAYIKQGGTVPPILGHGI